MTNLFSVSCLQHTTYIPGIHHCDYQHDSFLYSLSAGIFAGGDESEPDIQPGKIHDEYDPSDTPDEIRPADTPDEIKPDDRPHEIPPETPPEIEPDQLPRHPHKPAPVRDMAT